MQAAVIVQAHAWPQVQAGLCMHTTPHHDVSLHGASVGCSSSSSSSSADYKAFRGHKKHTAFMHAALPMPQASLQCMTLLQSHAPAACTSSRPACTHGCHVSSACRPQDPQHLTWTMVSANEMFASSGTMCVIESSCVLVGASVQLLTLLFGLGCHRSNTLCTIEGAGQRLSRVCAAQVAGT